MCAWKTQALTGKPPTEEIKALRMFSRRRDDVIHLQTIETNSLKSSALDTFGPDSAQRMLASFKLELKLINHKSVSNAYDQLFKHIYRSGG